MPYIDNLVHSLTLRDDESNIWSWSGVCEESLIPGWIEEVKGCIKEFRPSKKMYACVVELSQNVIRYAEKVSGSERLCAMLITEGQEAWRLQFASYASTDAARFVCSQCENLKMMDAQSLKELYQSQRKSFSAQGAGLGLIDLARKSDLPLDCKILRTDVEGIEVLLFTVSLLKDYR